MGLHQRYAEILGNDFSVSSLCLSKKEEEIDTIAKKWASVISNKFVREKAEEAARIALRHGIKVLPELREADRAESCYLMFLELLNKQKQVDPSSQPSILKAIVLCHRKELIVSGLFALLKVTTLSAGPLLLNAFIKVAEGDTAFKNEGFLQLIV